MMQWITGRLPDKPGFYLCTVPFDSNLNEKLTVLPFEFTYYKGSDGKFVNGFVYDSYDITATVIAWMEFPEPYDSDKRSDTKNESDGVISDLSIDEAI